jgi:hypothetical protein
MSYQVSSIIADVRKELDEIQVNSSGFATGVDNADLDAIIRHNLTDALEFCYTNADLSLLPVERQEIDSTFIQELTNTPNTGIITGWGRIRNIPTGKQVFVAPAVLPENFIRLAYARAKSWSRDVTEPIFWTDPAAAKLQDWYTTGTPERPVVYIGRSNNVISGLNKLVAVLYSVTSKQDTSYIAWVCKPTYVESGSGASTSIDIDSRIYGAVITYCAGLTLLTLKDKHAEDLFNQALVKMRVNIPKTK